MEKSEFDLRGAGVYRAHFLENQGAFVWQGDPMVMNHRLTVQKGTFLVPSCLSLDVDELLMQRSEATSMIRKIVFDVAAVRAEAMAFLYDANITNGSLFPGLDGLARSLSYELEHHWAFDPRTGALYPDFQDDRHALSLETCLDSIRAAVAHRHPVMDDEPDESGKELSPGRPTGS